MRRVSGSVFFRVTRRLYRAMLMTCQIQSQDAQEWYVNETYAGTWQERRGLTYVRVSSVVIDTDPAQALLIVDTSFRLPEDHIWSDSIYPTSRMT